MTFSYQDCLTPETILADVLVNVDDEKQKQFTHGWYMRQVKVAVEKLNFNAPFIQTYKDIDMTSDLIIPIPKGVWGLNDLFVWTPAGDCEDACKIGSIVRVFHKRNFMSKGYDTGYSARHMSNSSDYLNLYPYQEDHSTFFYNIHNGSIMLSDACVAYDKVRIHYNGVPTDISTVQFIPPFAREAIVAFVTERAFLALKARDPKYRAMWVDAQADLYGKRGYDQSKWDEVQSLTKRVDKKVWDDISEYLGRINA